MKRLSFATKRQQLAASAAQHAMAAGPTGIAIAPPTSDLNSADTPLIQRQAMPVGATRSISGVEQSQQTALPNPLKTGIEQLSGLALDDVRVHYNSKKPAQLQALAYAQGTDIYVGPGQERHLPHEAWHVVQQKQRRVSVTSQHAGISINNNPALEHEAHVMGRKATSMAPYSYDKERRDVPLDQSTVAAHHHYLTSSLSPIQLLRWTDLPAQVDSNGVQFDLDWDIYWQHGVTRGYINGNHFTLTGNQRDVRDIHYSYRFPNPHGPNEMQVYSWYNVRGDAPSIQIAGRKLEPGQTGPLNNTWRTYLRSVEGRNVINGTHVSNLTWAQFAAIPIGTLTIDRQIINFVKGLNRQPILNNQDVRGRITESFVDELVANNDVATLTNLFRSPRYPLGMWEQGAWTSMLNWVTS